MLAIYLFAMVLGGGFMVLSLLGGEGTEVDTDVDLDLDLDFGDADLAAGDLDVGDVGLDTQHGTAASRIFTFRTLVYGLFGFGATGALLTWMGIGVLLTLVVAVVGGIGAGAIVGSLFGWVRSTETDSHPADRDLIGRAGRVTLPMSMTVPGTVAIERGGRRVALRALPHSTGRGDPAEWSNVMVVEVEGGIVRVAPVDADALPPA